MTTKMLERRRAVAELLAQGVSAGEIAERVGVSERTISSDRQAINADPYTYGAAEVPSEPVEDDESSIVTDDGEPEQVDEPEADEPEDDELNPNEWLILELEGYTNARGIKAIAIIQKGLQLGYADGLTYEIDDESISMTRLDWTELREQFVDVAEAMPARLEKDDPNEYPGTQRQIVDMLGGLERFIEGRRSILKAA